MQITVKDVTKEYSGEIVLNKLSMTFTKGMNFVVGASGSGKTSLLRIIAGLDDDYTGLIEIGGQNIREITADQKSWLYNRVLGFVWQEPQLLEKLTVFENLQLVKTVSEAGSDEQILKILSELKIKSLANKLVSELSGGQKQRVSIARELAKGAIIFIADEPTSALDEKAAKNVINILREIAKTRTVIIVTHDLKLVNKNDTVIELDKGTISINFQQKKLDKFNEQLILGKPVAANFSRSLKLSFSLFKANLTKQLALVLTMLLAVVMTVVISVGMIGNTSENAFKELFDSYGPKLTEILIQTVSSVSQSGADGESTGNGNNQSADEIYQKYKSDPRVEDVYPTSSLMNEIKVAVNGKSADIQGVGITDINTDPERGTVTPGYSKYIAGSKITGPNQISLEKDIVEKMGLKPEDVIGKKLEYTGIINGVGLSMQEKALLLIDPENATNQGETKELKLTLTVAGVFENEFKGKTAESKKEQLIYSDDVYAKVAKTAGLPESPGNNFIIRAKTPADTVAIQNELTNVGVMAQSDSAKIEEILKMQGLASSLSKITAVVLCSLAVISFIAVSLFSAQARKLEFAIVKLVGFSQKQQKSLYVSEFMLILIASLLTYFILSPLISSLTTKFFSTSINSGNAPLIAVVVTLLFAIVNFSIIMISYKNQKMQKILNQTK
ncbi:MAG: ATP-binding cassette domain-containing protein [Mycoplasmatales bacterium]